MAKNEKLEKIHKDALVRFLNAQEFEREDRRFMEEDLSFAAGDQWPVEIEQARQREERPCLTFNRLPAFIEQVLGDARQNKPSIKVHPVDEGADPDRAEVLEGLVRNIESQSRATQAYITGLSHAVTGSRGAWRVVTEYTTDDAFEQDIRIKRIVNPFAVYWDPGCKEYDKSDAQWCFVSEWITKEMFEAKYPDDTPTDWMGEYRRLGAFNHWLTDERVRLAEYWVKEPVEKTLYLINHPELGPITTEEEPPEAALDSVIKTRKVKTHKVVRYLMSGHKVLEGPSEFPSKYIPIIPCFGPEEWVGDQVRYRSLIRYAKDPMRMYNYWQTTIAEKVSLAPKSPYVVTANMVKGYEKFWNEANTANRPYLPYNVDEMSPGLTPKRQEPAYVNASEIQQSQQAIEDLKATMGMFDASMGAQGNETSGRAIIARQREGDTATFAWIDNLSASIEHTGRVLIDIIPRIYDTQRVIRVLGEDDSVAMTPINFVDNDQIINDITVGKYDVTISVGPSYATKRMEAAASLIQFVQALPAAGQVAGDLIAKNMDWPGADDIADRLKKLLPPGIADDEDMDEEQRAQMQQEAEQAKQKEEMMFRLEVEGKEAETMSKRAKGAKDIQDARAQDIENDTVESGLAGLLETLGGV